ncbi:MAG: aspartate aminotransferase family protein [Myxococcales bacterium]|nr:aspartate aminotransferase family protein [Myxococcales bacterium]
MESHDDILRAGFDEYREFVNPLIAQRAALAGEPIKIVAARDGLLRDVEGHEFEDFHGTQAFDHRNPTITAAIREYLSTSAPSWYPSRVNPYAGRLARRLYERTGYDNAFFGCTGSDAIEAALKFARMLTRRPRILGLEGAYHGCTFGSVSLMAKGYLRDPFGPFVQGTESVPFGDVDALAAALAPGDVACVVVEPVQGEGGVRALPEPFIEALCELTQKHGTLLVADEVQTGMGRTGRGVLATERWPRRPDVVVMAKQLGGGIMPLSVMLTRRELFLKAYGDDFASGESHNNTLGTTAISCVAALAALELLTPERITRNQELGAWLKESLRDALTGSPLFREVRGVGMMMGVALEPPDHPWVSFEHLGFETSGVHGQSLISPLMCHRLYRRGFFCFTCGHDWSLFRLQPRFDIPKETLERFVLAVKDELAFIEGLQ